MIIIGALIAIGGSANIGVGVIVGGIGIAWLLLQKTVYHVMLTTAGGESSALSSKQREYIEKVVHALNDAIVARG